jgi:hypothetical protein
MLQHSDSSIDGISSGGEMMMAGGLASMVFAPSLGNWYAHRFWTRGQALRLAALPTLYAGAWLGLYDDRAREYSGVALTVAAVAMMAGGTVLDIIDAPRTVRAYNQRRVHAALAPIASAGTIGMSAVGTF